MVATGINQSALEGFKYVDEILVLNFGLFLKNPIALWRFLKRLRGFRPSFALDFDQWLRISPLLCFLSGAPRRFGFKTSHQFRHFLYRKTAPNDKRRHESEQFGSVAGLAGIEPGCIEPYNGFIEREGLFRGAVPAGARGGSKPLRVHFHPGCGSYGRQRAWPVESFARLAQMLSKSLPVEIRATGMGTYEENLVRKLIKISGMNIQDHSGRLEISRIAGLLRQADLVVCGNTGMMHLATGLGRPTVVLNGPADPVKWGPLDPLPPSPGSRVRVISSNLLCSPCTTLGFEYGCPYRCCMESIEVETVLEECLELLKT
jgi:ADP-heptose:LPS heptosyltransferase